MKTSSVTPNDRIPKIQITLIVLMANATTVRFHFVNDLDGLYSNETQTFSKFIIFIPRRYGRRLQITEQPESRASSKNHS
jgi:hypothetical protein